jgi:two-component system sensor histidine kinase DctS
VEIDLPTLVPRVNCDRTMVEQVLLNLVRNGIQAMEDEHIAPADRLLVIQVRPSTERWVEWQVTDQGPGIPPEIARQLFTPFFTTKSEGMGIGLSMCRTVIEQHGGALEFSSAVRAGHGTPDPPGGATGTAPAPNAPTPNRPHGTTFRFTLPAAPGPGARTVEAPPTGPPP